MGMDKYQAKEVPRCVAVAGDGRTIQLEECRNGLPAAESQMWLFTHTSSQIRFWKHPSQCLSLDLAGNASVKEGTRLRLARCEDTCDVVANPQKQGFCVDTHVFDEHLGTRKVKSSCRSIPSTTPGQRDRNDETHDTKCLQAENPDADGSRVMVAKCRSRRIRPNQVWRYFDFHKKTDARGGCDCDCMWILHTHADGSSACNSQSDDYSCCWGCCCKEKFQPRQCLWKQPACPISPLPC